MMPTRYSPKPGTTIKVDGRTFKVVADVDEINCLKCAFYPVKTQHKCQSPSVLNCQDVYFVEADETEQEKPHSLPAEVVESERMRNLVMAIAIIILIGATVYNILEGMTIN